MKFTSSGHVILRIDYSVDEGGAIDLQRSGSRGLIVDSTDISGRFIK